MAFVIAEPCIGVKDTACVEACPVADRRFVTRVAVNLMAVRFKEGGNYV
jgi:NAD-dependent dihydropyrimidine dehydrogenase PreA subunit